MGDPSVLEPSTDPDVLRAARLAELANAEHVFVATMPFGYERDRALYNLALERAALSGEPAPAAPVETIRVAWLKAALAEIDKLNAVNAAISDPLLLALWTSATEIRRDDPDMIAVATALAIDLDDLWVRARTIRAARGPTPG